MHRYKEILVGNRSDLIKLFKSMLRSADINTKREMLTLLEEQLNANRKN